MEKKIEKNGNGQLIKRSFSNWFNLYDREAVWHKQKMQFWCFLAVFFTYARDSHDHIGWATLEFLCSQQIKLFQVFPTSEFHEYWWNDLENVVLVPASFCRASEARTQSRLSTLDSLYLAGIAKYKESRILKVDHNYFTFQAWKKFGAFFQSLK